MDPLRIEFGVNCPVEDAFRLWAVDTSLWWPPGHSVSGESGLRVEFEPRVGGRIFERTADGREADWGEITAWEPPRRLAYLWHLRHDRADATRVEVSFAASAEGTAVTIVHSGWERLGARGEGLRERNQRGWGGLLPHFERICAAG